MQGIMHGTCVHRLGLDVCFDEYNYHDSLQARLVVIIKLAKL